MRSMLLLRCLVIFVAAMVLSDLEVNAAGPTSPLLSSAEGHASPMQPIAQRSCGLRLDGVGPDARCSRYREACLRHGNSAVRCEERLEACTRCAVDFQECEKRVGRVAGLLTTCDKCVATFKRCNREYDRLLPAKQR